MFCAIFRTSGAFEQRLQPRQHGVSGQLPGNEIAAAEKVAPAFAPVTQWDIAGAPRREAKREADELGLHRIERGGFGVDRQLAFLPRRGDPDIEPLEALHGFITLDVEFFSARLGGAFCRQFAGTGCDGRPRRLFAVAGVALRPVWHAGGRSQRIVRRLRRWHSGAVAAAPAGSSRERRVRLDEAGLDAIGFGRALGDCRKLQRLEEGDQRLAVRRSEGEVVERNFQRHVADERDELLRCPDQRNAVRIGQDLAPLRLLDLARAGKELVEVAIFIDELGGGFQADAAGPRHIVGRIAGQRLHVDDFFGRHAEVGGDFVEADAALLARALRAGFAGRRIVHGYAGPDELHQILVRRNDQNVGAALLRLSRIGGDKIVGLEAVLFNRQQAEGAHGGAHQRELRNEIVRGLRAIALIGRINLLAEGVFRFVEDDGEMRRDDPRRAFADELEQFGAEQPHRAGRQAVRAIVIFCVLADRLEIGAEDER